jgi:hypothetical protein
MLRLLRELLTRWGLNPTARQWHDYELTDDDIVDYVEAIKPVDINDNDEYN